MDILAALIVCALGLTVIDFGNHNFSAVSMPMRIALIAMMLMGIALIEIGGSYIIFVFLQLVLGG